MDFSGHALRKTPTALDLFLLRSGVSRESVTACDQRALSFFCHCNNCETIVKHFFLYFPAEGCFGEDIHTKRSIKKKTRFNTNNLTITKLFY